MHRWLRQPSLFDEAVDVDTSEGGGQHEHVVPQRCQGYYTFASVRDEEERVLSLWRMSRSEAQRGEPTPLMTLREFVEWRVTAKPFYSWPLERYLPERLDTRLRFEHLEEDVRRLPFYMPLRDRLELLPHVNRNPRNPKSAEADLLLEFGGYA